MLPVWQPAGQDLPGNRMSYLVGSSNHPVELMALAAQQRVQLHTVKCPLDRFADAVADLDAGRIRGRAILVP